MKKISKYLILPAIQAMLSTPLLILNDLNLPHEMSAYMALGVIALAILIILSIRLLCIYISSLVINISKLIIYRMKGEQIISICLWPMFIYNKKVSIANIFWVYDDRTCFSMNKYLKDAESFEKLRGFIKMRNRILTCIYIIFSVSIITLCIFNNQTTIAIVMGVGFIEHFLYQFEYKTIESSYGMAFSGITGVNNRLLLHMIVNQSKIEELYIGKEVADILAEDMYDRNGGYFFNYLCLSSMFAESAANIPAKERFFLFEKMKEKVDSIIEGNDKALNLIKYKYNDVIYKNIDDYICLFYDNYREFLLYVLMYYKICGMHEEYKQLCNYTEYMLSRVEIECVNDSKLSMAVLEDKFYEYKNLYTDVLEGGFMPETSIFTGYDTLPVWKENRNHFIKKFREC